MQRKSNVGKINSRGSNSNGTARHQAPSAKARALVNLDRPTVGRTAGQGRSKANPETPEETEKRLARRKALTLKAFRMAYESHRGRELS